MYNLMSRNCEVISEMVKKYPAELFLQTFHPRLSWSALHVAVLESSQTLTHTLMEKLRELKRSGSKDLQSVVENFMLHVDKCELSALNMASIIENEEILSLVELNPSESLPCFGSIKPRNLCHPHTSEDEERNLLEEASRLLDKQSPTSSYQGTMQQWLDDEEDDEEVAFVYCLHAIGEISYPCRKKAWEFVKHVCDTGDFSYIKPLLDVRDKLGRSPLHIYTYKHSYGWLPDVKTFFEMMVTHYPDLDWNMGDFMGRTPLHWAAAQGLVEVVTFLASQEKTNLNATYGNHWLYFSREDQEGRNFDAHGLVEDVTPLHLAVIHNHVEVVKALLKVPKGSPLI